MGRFGLALHQSVQRAGRFQADNPDRGCGAHGAGELTVPIATISQKLKGDDSIFVLLNLGFRYGKSNSFSKQQIQWFCEFDTYRLAHCRCAKREKRLDRLASAAYRREHKL